ncbi:MAG: penicillin-binding protein [Nitrospirae bacterium]|nr:penicillin-binding protein [Nitrospirota bacterium]
MKKYLFAGLGAFVFCVLIIVVWTMRVLSNLPDVSTLKHYRPAAAAEVLDKDNNPLTLYYDRKFRIWVPITGLPDIVINAVVIAEDDTFFEHHGVNYKATRDAMLHDVKKRKFSRGGSTITQQMIKNVFLSREKTLTRKLREYVLARKAEEILSKRRILEIYLNEVEWGENIYGIEAASRFYLDKHASELTIAEAALLAGMLPNPRYYNPYKRPEAAGKRQKRVLFNMQQAKDITQDEYAAALQEPLNLRPEGSNRMDLSALTAGNSGQCYQQVLERMLVALIGEHDLYRRGGTIRTTLEKALQNELSSLEGSMQERAGETSGRIPVVMQGNKIRAIVCGEGREVEVRSKLESLGMSYIGYDVGAIAIDAIQREQIMETADEEKK